MKVQLVKREDRWDLYDNTGHKIGSTLEGCPYKISLKNCEAIELGYDLDELASEYSKKREDLDLVYANGLYYGFLEGFQKALEILGDKKFSEKDMSRMMLATSEWLNSEIEYGADELIKKVIQSLQQTEWDVRIDGLLTERHGGVVNETPKLDADGCLILKNKENG